MNNLSGLGLNLRDLDALKRQNEKQNVNGDNGARKNEGVSNVFDEGLGFSTQGAEGSIFNDISEIEEEDIETTETEEESETEKDSAENSLIQALTGAIENLIGSLFSKGGVGTPSTSMPPTGVDNSKINNDLNKLFIDDDATISELEKIKQETIQQFEHDINTKKAEKEQFIASQENIKEGINSQMNQQKIEISSTKDEIKNTENQISDTNSKISSVESEISSLRSALSSINSEDENAVAKKSAIEAKIQELEAQKSELETKKTELETKKSDLEKTLANKEQELMNLETAFKNVEAETTKTIQVFEQEISSLENSKNTEVSKIDFKIAQAQARETKKQNEEEETTHNIFAMA